MRKKWTPECDAKLRAMYADCEMAEICSALGRSVSAIRGHASKLGLRRTNSPDIRERGLRHSERMIEKRRNGYRNTTRVEVGEVRIQGGRPMCKVSDTGDANVDWIPAARAAWISLKGPIAPGYNVICKDGNRSNTEADNLELITVQEKISRNSIARYPLTYQRAAQALGRFVAKLKRLEKEHEKSE
ncbi:HNH endonuclease [Pseudomonas sp. NFR16]|uniref:HNH endonuclease n=1 Tax=Pseudomonas sp. NFR16 TaxID=1566248 RepID=UPI0008AE1CBA|nr:HNH endonuclease [Pseudomonas sp. NFR16]SEJ50395.1 HNH endonuclease [Pseudomonas sp. NFR16]